MFLRGYLKQIKQEKMAMYEQLNEKTRYWLNLAEIDMLEGTSKEKIRANYYLSYESRQDVWDSWLETEKQTRNLEVTNEPSSQTNDSEVTAEPQGQTGDPNMTADHEEKERTSVKLVFLVLVIVGVSAGILIFRKCKKA